MKDGFYISTDKAKLDVALIQRYLSTKSYWAEGRDLETVKKTIKHSLCFGMYRDNKQVGFARVVTDYSVFAWIMDVFILPEFQGKGLGSQLMEAILSYPELQQLQRWGLATKDAHALYAKFGFGPLSKPERVMERIKKTSK